MAATPQPPTRLLLLGLMAAGKSTVGTALANRLQRPYLDNDVLLAQQTGSSLPQLAQLGIDGLHASERSVFDSLLRHPGPWVASAAASIVMDPDAVLELRRSGVTSVWLRATPETLAAHAGSGAGRPLLQPDPLAVFREMVHDRSEAFASSADVIVDIDGKPLDAIVSDVISAVSR